MTQDHTSHNHDHGHKSPMLHIIQWNNVEGSRDDNVIWHG